MARRNPVTQEKSRKPGFVERFVGGPSELPEPSARNELRRSSDVPELQPFSPAWVLASMVMFIAVELALGGLIGQVIVGRYMSAALEYSLQGMLHLVSFYVGGFLIGLISPRIRLMEPAIGAVCSMGVLLLASLITPYGWFAFNPLFLLIAATVSFFLALAGAMTGERIAGNL